jgi:hypothetical protein
MDNYLKGEYSANRLRFLLDQDHEKWHELSTGKNDFGIHQDGDKWITFDNREGECFTEEFDTEQEAINWLMNEDDDDSDSEPTASLKWVLEVHTHKGAMLRAIRQGMLEEINTHLKTLLQPDQCLVPARKDSEVFMIDDHTAMRAVLIHGTLGAVWVSGHIDVDDAKQASPEDGYHIAMPLAEALTESLAYLCDTMLDPNAWEVVPFNPTSAEAEALLCSVSTVETYEDALHYWKTAKQVYANNEDVSVDFASPDNSHDEEEDNSDFYAFYVDEEQYATLIENDDATAVYKHFRFGITGTYHEVVLNLTEDQKVAFLDIF